jgi:hypothetical protein
MFPSLEILNFMCLILYAQVTNMFHGYMLDYNSESEENIEAIPFGGGVEYLHRDPASRRMRRKGKP